MGGRVIIAAIDPVATWCPVQSRQSNVRDCRYRPTASARERFLATQCDRIFDRNS